MTRTLDDPPHYVVAGDGEDALLMIHGFGSDHTDWNAQMAALKGRYRVIACDLPGHGASPAAPDVDIGALARAVNRIRREEAPRRVILVGHSMGVRVALEACRQAPEGVAGVVLVDGSQVTAGGGRDALEVMRGQLQTHGVRALLLHIFDGMFEDEQDPLKRAALDRLARMGPEVSQSIMLSMAAWDRDEADAVLAALPVPLMLVSSTFLDLMKGRLSLTHRGDSPWIAHVAALVPSVEVHVVQHTRHYLQIEKAPAVNAALEGFARRVFA